MNIPTNYWSNLIILAVLLKCGKCDEINDECKHCMKNGVACLDQKRFATCYKGTITDNIIRCPDNMVCTADANICLERTQVIEPICNEIKCGTCEYTNGRFACLDETSYGFCYGGVEPNLESIRVCPLDYVCDYNSPQICISKDIATSLCIPSTEDPSLTTTDSSHITDFTTTTIYSDTTSSTTDVNDITESTTVSSTTDVSDITETTYDSSTTDVNDNIKTTTDVNDITETTTESSTITVSDITDTTAVSSTTTDDSSVTTSNPTNPTTAETIPTDPNIFCADMQSIGYFRSTGDITCKDYILCYLLSGQYLGQKYTCAGYFNADVEKCQNEKPDNC